MFKLRLWGARLVTKDVSDPYFIVLRCPFNLLRVFKDCTHRSKTEFMLGPSSGVNVSSDTILFVDLPYTIIHASRAQFPSPPGSGVNLTPEPGNILLIALFNKRTPWSEAFNFRQSCNCLQNLPNRENRLFFSSHSCHPPPWEALQWHGWGARYVCVGS